MYSTPVILMLLGLTFHFGRCQLNTGAVFMSDDVTYGCHGYVDLVLVVESSASTRYMTPIGVSIWHPGITVFVSNLMRVLQVSPASFRVAAVLYSTGIDDVMPFSVHQLYALNAFGYLRPGYGSAATAKGLSEMRRMLSYYGRPGAAKRAVLLSATLSDDHQATVAEANLARSMGIDIISVGFGRFRNIIELSRISPGWVLEVPDAGMLYALAGRVAARLCKSAVNGGWSSWNTWSPCSKQCDGGITRRYRFCNNPLPQYGGLFCVGLPDMLKQCNTEPCLSFFSRGTSWSSWGPCSVTCGTGSRRRSRPCISVSRCKQQGESEVQTGTCYAPVCPVEFAWSDWMPWEPCSVTCGKGVRQRRRTCIVATTDQDVGHCLGPGMDNDLCDTSIICQECENCTLGPGSRRYVSCPHDCSKYVQCPSSGYMTLEKVCPHGLLWSNEHQACVEPANSQCNACFGRPTGSQVEYFQSCKEFWDCGEDGTIRLRCCPDGFLFVTGLGCMRDVDNSCTKKCYAEPSLDFSGTNCTSRLSPLGSYWYEEVTSGKRKTRACPIGTQFSPPVCRCIMAHELTPDLFFSRGCHTMVNMEFQSREKDIENTPSKIRYKNVLYINNESALMRQNSSMRFWYFSNTEWGDKVFIHTRILPEIKTPPTAILHNGGCETYAEPTLLIGMDNAQDQNKAVYIFGITMEEANEMVFINLTTKRNSDYSDVALRFDGYALDVEVNGKTAVMNFDKKGKIARSRGALQLGGKACSIGYSAFSGLVDSLKVTRCGEE